MILLNTVILILVGAALAKDNVKIPQLDHVIDSLSSQQWDDDEATCRDKIFSLLYNVKNSTLWATWIWDSNTKAPTGTFFGARFHLGNYDQCLRPPWLSEHPELRTQYCLADVEMSKNPAVKNWDLPGPYARAEEYYVDGGTPTGRRFSFMSYGVCLPAGCQSESVAKYVKALLSGQHLQAAWHADVQIQHCEEAGAPIVHPRGYYVYMYIFVVLAFIALTSTYYLSEYPERATSDTFVNHVAKSFYLRRNWETVFKQEKNALPSLYGIRFLSAASLVLLHSTSYTSKISIANAIDTESGFETLEKGLFMRLDLLADAFFAMSALVLGLSLSTLDVTKPYNLLRNIIKRYIRLMGSFAVTIFYVAYVLLQRDNGPLYPKLMKIEQESCEQNWWLALLMVGNYFKTDAMCYTCTWYIACDFHFYVITVALLYIYRKNPKLGKNITAIVVVLGILGPAINLYFYDLPAVTNLNSRLDIEMRLTKNYTKGYIATHLRMGPYIAGLLVGYLMSLYKPTDYTKIWSKTTSYLGVCAGLALMVAVGVAGALCYQYRVYGALAAVYRTLDRTVYGIAVLCVIVFCTYGDVPLVTSSLSWTPFRALSHLTYGIYLYNPALLFRSKMAARGHARGHVPDFLVEAFGTLSVAVMLSLAVWLLVEAPLINFTNRYLSTRSESKMTQVGPNQNGETVENAAVKTKVL